MRLIDVVLGIAFVELHSNSLATVNWICETRQENIREFKWDMTGEHCQLLDRPQNVGKVCYIKSVVDNYLLKDPVLFTFVWSSGVCLVRVFSFNTVKQCQVRSIIISHQIIFTVRSSLESCHCNIPFNKVGMKVATYGEYKPTITWITNLKFIQRKKILKI